MIQVHTTKAEQRQQGLTLLEILAATLIFSMVMTVLISTSSTAVYHVGASSRRLEASQLADEIVADLEIAMKQGIAPLVDESATTRNQYEIQIMRSDLVEELAGGGATAGGLDVASLLSAELPEVAKHLKQYDIEISWIEQGGPQTVTRTTFAFDWETASIEFADLFDRESRIGIGNNQSDEDGTGDGALGGSGDGSGNGRDRGRSGNGSAEPGVDPNRGNGHNARLRALARDPVSN